MYNHNHMILCDIAWLYMYITCVTLHRLHIYTKNAHGQSEL